MDFDEIVAAHRRELLAHCYRMTGSIQDGKNGTVTYGYDNVGNRLNRTSSLSGVTRFCSGIAGS